MADVVAHLKADVSNYDAGLAKATKGLKNFAAQNTTVNGIMAQGMTMLTKFAGGFAAAQLAMKAFNAVVMEGSQTTGDFVRNGLGALNDTMGVLASSVATFDWSPFEDGLLRTFERAKALREELDLLWNLQTARGVVSSDTMEKVRSAQATANNPNAGDEERQTAVKAAQDAIDDLTKANDNIIKSTRKAISGQVELYSSVKATADEVVQVYRNVAIQGDVVINEYKKVGRTLANYDRDIITTQQGLAALNSGNTYVAAGTVKQYKDQLDALVKVRDEYAASHREQLIGYAVTEKFNDKQFKQTAEQIQSISSMRAETERLQKTLNSTANKVDNVTRTGVATPSAREAPGVASGMSVTAERGPSVFEGDVRSMKELTDEARKLQIVMETTGSSDIFNQVLQRYETLQAQIEAQPLALKANISIEEAVIQQQLDELGENLRLDMKANVEVNTQSMDKAAKSGKESEKSWDAASRALASAGNALQSIDNKGLNVAGTIMEAIANVALGFASAMSSPATTATGMFGWIAAAAAGTATMIATIAAIKSQTKGSYAQGGIVPGSYNGGVDNTYVYASPGEVILNRSQQENLLSQLGDEGGGSVSVALKGEQLAVVLNNYGRRRGKGELLFG
ncbi:MAG: hypothetical protein LUD72_03825 [Bacteroidales bacterium]|nr:hypothetical protein [Bacteroidales bacterium]